MSTSTIKHALRQSPDAIAKLKRFGDEIATMECAKAVELGAQKTAEILSDKNTVKAIKAFLEGETLPWFERYKPRGEEK